MPTKPIDKHKRIMELNKDDVLGVVVQGWCTNRNSKKCMDASLAMDITDAICRNFGAPNITVEKIVEIVHETLDGTLSYYHCEALARRIVQRLGREK